jgi:hypothetical protein
LRCKELKSSKRRGHAHTSPQSVEKLVYAINNYSCPKPAREGHSILFKSNPHMADPLLFRLASVCVCVCVCVCVSARMSLWL